MVVTAFEAGWLHTVVNCDDDVKEKKPAHTDTHRQTLTQTHTGTHTLTLKQAQTHHSDKCAAHHTGADGPLNVQSFVHVGATLDRMITTQEVTTDAIP